MSRSLRPGEIVAYPYLWKWQHEKGETEGRKERPVCVVIAVRGSKDDLTHLALLAISSQPPSIPQTAIEIPEIECRRSGLGEFKRAWITISEYNYDIAERSFYFDQAQPVLGRFSKSFMMQLAKAVGPLMRQGRGRIDRTD